MFKVGTRFVGEVWPAARAGEDPVIYGSVNVSRSVVFEARSLQTFRLVSPGSGRTRGRRRRLAMATGGAVR